MKKSSKEMSLFKKLTALPYLLVFLALLMPLANVSCSVKEDSKQIAEATFYQIASGRFGKVFVGCCSWADAPHGQGKSENLGSFQDADAELPENGTDSSFVRNPRCDFPCRRFFAVRSSCIDGNGTFVDGFAMVAFDEAIAGRGYAWNPAIEN